LSLAAVVGVITHKAPVVVVAQVDYLLAMLVLHLVLHTL
jgi:hypothetical protein